MLFPAPFCAKCKKQNCLLAHIKTLLPMSEDGKDAMAQFGVGNGRRAHDSD